MVYLCQCALVCRHKRPDREGCDGPIIHQNRGPCHRWPPSSWKLGRSSFQEDSRGPHPADCGQSDSPPCAPRRAPRGGRREARPRRRGLFLPPVAIPMAQRGGLRGGRQAQRPPPRARSSSPPARHSDGARGGLRGGNRHKGPLPNPPPEAGRGRTTRPASGAHTSSSPPARHSDGARGGLRGGQKRDPT